MIDHIEVLVHDTALSTGFYRQALALEIKTNGLEPLIAELVRREG